MAKKQSGGKGEDTAELLTQLISRRLLQRVADETNETEALRKALFTLILATQDKAGTAATEVIQWLLTTFPPLVEPTRNTMYDLGDGAGVGRAREHQGDKVLLVIAKDFVESLLPKESKKRRSKPK